MQNINATLFRASRGFCFVLLPHLDGDHGLGPFSRVPYPDRLIRAAGRENRLLCRTPLEVLDAAFMPVERPAYLPPTALLEHGKHFNQMGVDMH